MPRIPRATYRLQLTPRFGFGAAVDLLDYLDRLGVSDLYLSPCLEAVSGSEHGYDVVDPERVREQFGGEEGFDALAAELARRGMGLLLDIVPNHMAVGTPLNRYWWDVLENGPASEHAAFFDVDWDSSADNRVLLPVLGARYAECLEGGELRLERRGARFMVRYHEHAFPAAPRSVAELLRPALASGADLLDAAARDEFEFVADSLAELADPWTADHDEAVRRRRDKDVLFARLERLVTDHAAFAARIDQELVRSSCDPERLDLWLQRQNWKLAYWKSAATDLGYRRFFDIHTLAGLRAEDAAVFEATHARVIAWVQAGKVSGLRVDHIDGLRDPEGYLQRLRDAAPQAYTIVEKILEPDERLPSSWPVEGTTGYEFLRLVDQVHVDPAGAPALRALAERLTGQRGPFDAIVQQAKYEVVKHLLTSERDRVVEFALRALSQRRELRDVTRHELRDALTHLLVGYRGYRSYVRSQSGASEEDRARIGAAIARAKAAHPAGDSRLWEGLEKALLLDPPYEHAVDFALAVQQMTGAVAAKAAEDTACYRYLPLLALNEVGGSPGTFGITLAEFHAAMATLSGSRSMLASSTHDTKRGEDTRARLLVLSGMADEWVAFAGDVLERAARHAEPLVDSAARYLFLQTLVATHPLSLERAERYMEKALREAKLHTSWSAPDEAYEAAVRRYLGRFLGDDALMRDVGAFAGRLAPAGYAVSLSRSLIKLTAPGVPDFYQGSELWDFCLVDPDNRAPVDFAERERLLERALAASPREAMAAAKSGLPKLFLVSKSLALRKRRPQAFALPYRPLEVRGADADAVIAYARGEDLVIVAPRWPLRAERGLDAAVELPDARYRDVLAGRAVPFGDGPAALESLLAEFPVALLEREP